MPPDEEFKKEFLKDAVELRQRMSNAIHTVAPNDQISQMDGYRATDELNELDQVFFND